MIREAIDHYHQLLSGEFLDSTVEVLETEKTRLSVKGRPVCNVLRPFFIDHTTYARVCLASDLILRGLRSLSERLLLDPSFRLEMDLTPEEDEIVQVDTGYGAPDVNARLDGFLDLEGDFRFVEYNADSPGGVGYGDALADVFSSMPILESFSQRFPTRTIPVREKVFEALLTAYRKWGGKDLPNIAIVDWSDVATRSEFPLFQSVFEQNGCRVRIGSPDELEYKNGRLWMDEFPVDLIYKRLVVGEMLARYGTQHPLVKAAKDHAVCVANGFAVQMIFKKMLFVLLSDPAYSRYLDPEVVAAIAHHVPWTRKVKECYTEKGGNQVDLIPYVRNNRENLVLKPNSEYGGRGVVLGWECTDSEWDAALRNALKHLSIVQERVAIAKEPYPALMNGELYIEERYFDLDPYAWNGVHAEGCGVRLSRSSLLNVSAGGGSAVPMFILSKNS